MERLSIRDAAELLAGARPGSRRWPFMNPFDTRLSYLVVARYGDEPGEAEAEHMQNLDLESSAFLLAAYRLYLDESGKAPVPGSAVHPGEPLKS